MTRHYRYPNKRIGGRAANGRFSRLTTEQVFGLSVVVCTNPDCRALVPYEPLEERGGFVARAAPPATCPQCGSPTTR